MTYITSIEELEKQIRNILISQSQVDGKFVRNAHTEFGVDLDKKFGSVFETLTQDDVAILFDLETSDTSDNMSETVNEQTTIYQSFKAKIIIYGLQSSLLAELLVARLRTEAVRDALHDVGIHLITVDSPTKIEEFKNGVIWSRYDFDIDFACQILVSSITSSYEYEDYSTITIETMQGGF